MEEQQTTESPATESVQVDSQPSQNASQDVGNTAATQTKTEEMVSRLEYNKSREAARKYQSELSKLTARLESAKGGIQLHDELSKASPEKIAKIKQMLFEQAQQPQEDESWLNEIDERVANKFRDQGKLKQMVERDLLSRLNSIEQKLNSTESWSVGQNEKALENTFSGFLTQNKIFSEITEEVEQSPKFQMIQSYVLNRLAENGQNPKMASVEDLQAILNDVKRGVSEISKQESIGKVQPIVPLSGSKAGQIPKSEKVTEKDVTDLWSSFKQGVGW